jgi:hypothetical protein
MLHCAVQVAVQCGTGALSGRAIRLMKFSYINSLIGLLAVFRWR